MVFGVGEVRAGGEQPQQRYGGAFIDDHPLRLLLGSDLPAGGQDADFFDDGVGFTDHQIV